MTDVRPIPARKRHGGGLFGASLRPVPVVFLAATLTVAAPGDPPAAAVTGTADTAALELGETTARAAPRAVSTRAATSLAGQDLERRLGRTLGDALTAVDGVTMLQSGPTIAKPEIRGLQGNLIQILNNGVKLEGQLWGSEHAPEVDPFTAGSMTVVKGASGVRYGPEALGGVVLVTPRPLRASPGHDGEWHALATTAGWGGATALRYDLAPAAAPGLALRAQGTVRRLGDQSAPRYNLANTGVAELNGTLAAGYGTANWHGEVFYSRFRTRLGILSAAHIGNLSDLEAAIARDEPEVTGPFDYGIDRPRQEVVHDLVKVQGGKHWDAGHLELAWSFQNNDRSEYDSHRPRNDSLAARDRPELRFTIYTHAGEAVFEHARRGGFTGEIGAAASVQGNASHGRSFVPNFMNYGGGIFAVERWSGTRWGAEAGLRYDMRLLEVFRNIDGTVVRTEFPRTGWSAALGGLHRVGATETRLNVSTAWRPPAANELYSNGLHHGAAAVEYGDTALGPETAYNAAVSWRYAAASSPRPPSRPFVREASLEVFGTFIKDYIGLEADTPATLTIRGAFPTFRYRSTDAFLRGAEARVTTMPSPRLPWLEAGARGSLLWATDREGAGLLFSPAHRVEGALTARADRWRDATGLFITGRVQAVARQGDPAPADYAPPPAGHVLLHAETGFTWMTGAGPLDVELQGRNLLDRVYRDYTNRFRYYADEAGREIALRFKLAFGS